MADEFGKNPSYLSRSFLRLTGTSILDYIHFYRIQEQKSSLAGAKPLRQQRQLWATPMCSPMSRAFKKYEGTTPGKFKS